MGWPVALPSTVPWFAAGLVTGLVAGGVGVVLFFSYRIIAAAREP
jgi:hypothetical protein